MTWRYGIYPDPGRGYKAYRSAEESFGAVWGPRRWTPGGALRALLRRDAGRSLRQRWRRHKQRRADKAMERSRPNEGNA